MEGVLTARMYVFPLDRRVGYVREKAAKLLNRRDKADADRYLTDVIGFSRGSLYHIAPDPDPEFEALIERELVALRAAVIAESWRITMETNRSGTERA